MNILYTDKITIDFIDSVSIDLIDTNFDRTDNCRIIFDVIFAIQSTEKIFNNSGRTEGIELKYLGLVENGSKFDNFRIYYEGYDVDENNQEIELIIDNSWSIYIDDMQNLLLDNVEINIQEKAIALYF